MFDDRAHAGLLLAHQLTDGDIVCAIPRGGVPVAAIIARRLSLPLSIIAVKKIVSPDQPEFARGAASSVLVESDPDTPASWVKSAQEHARAIESTLGSADVAGKRVILVDDGAATGRTFLLAIDTARRLGAASIIAALPVASREAASQIRFRSDDAFILETPETFFAVGAFYRSFEQVGEDEAKRLIDHAKDS